MPTSHHARAARVLDAMCAPPGPPAARMSETERRDLANELAAAGFYLEYLAHRYDLPTRTTPGHDRGGQRQLSAPDNPEAGHTNDRLPEQNSHRSVALERTR